MTNLFQVDDESQVAEARRRAVALADRAGFDATEAGRVAIVATELSTNLLKHGGGGVILADPFDDPTGIAPVIQWGTEAKLPYVDGIAGLPGEDTMADIADAPFLADLVSYQHPDHDTEEWPPAARPEGKP